MTNPKTMFVRHVHTGQIKKVSEEQRATQDKNYWVRVTGDVEETAPETEPAPATDAPAETPAKTAAKTTSKAETPAK